MPERLTEKEFIEALEKGDHVAALEAFQYEQMSTSVAENSARAWQDEALAGLSQQLINRVGRLKRLLELNAPLVIARSERGMVMQSLGAFLGDEDPDNFTLPTYTATRLDPMGEKE